MRLVVVEGWDREIAVSLAVLFCFAAACLGISAQQFREKTADRVS